MENIGLDLHQRESQLCCLTEEGEIVEFRTRTRRAGSWRCWGAGPGRAS